MAIVQADLNLVPNLKQLSVDINASNVPSYYSGYLANTDSPIKINDAGHAIVEGDLAPIPFLLGHNFRSWGDFHDNAYWGSSSHNHLWIHYPNTELAKIKNLERDKITHLNITMLVIRPETWQESYLWAIDPSRMLWMSMADVPNGNNNTESATPTNSSYDTRFFTDKLKDSNNPFVQGYFQNETFSYADVFVQSNSAFNYANILAEAQARGLTTIGGVGDYDRLQGSNQQFISPYDDSIVVENQFGSNPAKALLIINNDLVAPFEINGVTYGYVTASIPIDLISGTRRIEVLLNTWLDGINADPNFIPREGLLLNWEKDDGQYAFVYGVGTKVAYTGEIIPLNPEGGYFTNDMGTEIDYSVNTTYPDEAPPNDDSNVPNETIKEFPTCTDTDTEAKDFAVVTEAFYGVRPETIETNNRLVPFTKYLPEYLQDFKYSELYRFFECYFNTMYEVEREKERFVVNGQTTEVVKTHFISLLEKINRISDFDNPFEIQWNLISKFAEERGFSFGIPTYEGEQFSTQFKKSVRGMLSDLPTLLSTKGTRDSIRATMALLGFYADVRQRYYDVEYRVGGVQPQGMPTTEQAQYYPTNCETPAFRMIGDTYTEKVAFTRDVYEDVDELQLLESHPDLRNDVDVYQDGSLTLGSTRRSKNVGIPIYEIDLLVRPEDLPDAPQRIQIALENLKKIRPANSVFDVGSVGIDLGVNFQVSFSDQYNVLLEDIANAIDQGLVFEDLVLSPEVALDGIDGTAVEEMYDNEQGENPPPPN